MTESTKALKPLDLKEDIMKLIRDNDEYVIGALITLYQKQTSEERATFQTNEPNNIGFNSFDAPILTDIATHYLQWKTLSPKQINFVRNTIQKYWKQLLNLNPDPLPLLKREDKEKAEGKVVLWAGLGEKKIKIKFSYPQGDKRFADMVAKVKSLSGRSWNPSEKYWTAILCTGNTDLLKEWGFEFANGLQDWIKKMSYPEVKSNIDIPGLKCDLFPFQKEGVAFIESRNGRALLAHEMGLGKTVQALAWLQLNKDKALPAIVVVPASVKINWLREVKHWCPELKARILYGAKPDASAISKNIDIYIVNYDIVSDKEQENKKTKKLEIIEQRWGSFLTKNLDVKTLVLDECFIAGTKINTPNGNKNIEDLKVGDQVLNAIGKGTIKAIGQREVIGELVKLYLSNGKQIVCTKNHLFFSENGWVEAIKTKDKKIFTSSLIFNIMRNNILLKNLYKGNNNEKKNRRENLPTMQKEILCPPIRNKAFLRELLFNEMENESTRICEGDSLKNKNQNALREKIQNNEKNSQRKALDSGTSINQNEEKQSNDEPQNSRKNETTFQKIWSSIKRATIKRGKWKTHPLCTKNSLGSISRWMDFRISHKNKSSKKSRLPNLLQSGYSKSRIKNMDRSRWVGSSIARWKEKRQKERRFFKDIRVERIEVLESGNRGRYQNGSCKSTTVYNIEVSGHPSYFAEDILVHNCHLIKDSKTQRARTIKRISKNIPYIIALTGTPVVNRPVEFFNSLNMISPERFPSFWDYAQEYCGATHNGYGWDFKGATNIEKLNKLLIESIMIRRLKADVMKDLPAKIKTLVPLEINNRNKYQDEFDYTLRDNKYKEPGDQLAEIERLKQICLNGKIDSIYAWIDDFLESGQKLVIFATHHKAIDMLMDRYSQIAVKLDGRDNQTQRQGAVDSFQNIDECKLFIGNIKAAGVGLTLTAASNVAFIELPWTPSDIDQSSDRVHRIGQEADCVNIYYLVAEDTIEEDICELLDEKRKVIDMVLDGKQTEEVSLLTELLKRMNDRRNNKA